MAEAPKRGRGRPPHVPTSQQRDQVVVLTATGWTHTDISKFFNITEKVLRKNYRAELAAGKAKFGQALTVKLAQQALAGKLPAIFFILKTQYGWRENFGLQPLGKDGEPIDLNRLSTESLVQVLTRLRTGGDSEGDRGDPGAAEGWPSHLMDPPAGSAD